MAKEETTYWNGEPLAKPARRCVVRVGDVKKKSWWSYGLTGTERRAVEVRYAGDVFYIDDDDGEGTPERSEDQKAMLEGFHNGNPPRPEPKAGDGWLKVTKGKGAPFGEYSRFRSLPSDSEVIRYLNQDGSEIGSASTGAQA